MNITCLIRHRLVTNLETLTRWCESEKKCHPVESGINFFLPKCDKGFSPNPSKGVSLGFS